MNAKISAYLMILFLLNLFSFIYPQQKQKTEANADIVEYTNKEGLPTTNISNIVQTKDGYIWLSGIEGTYRFNGYDFEEVGREYGLPEMQNMYYDSTKNILYFASPKKFITFNGKEFKSYSENEGYSINGLSGQVIRFIAADSKGRIWIGSATPFIDKQFNGGLTKFENGKFSVYDSTSFPLDNATDVIETPYGDLIFSSFGRNTQTREGSYIALYKNGIFKKIDETAGIKLQNAAIFPPNLSTSIDKDGNTWLAFYGILTSASAAQNSSGVLMYDGTKFHQYTDFLNNLGKKQFPLQVYYSKQLDKIFLTTSTSSNEFEIFNSNNKSIYEFDNGKWKHSNIIESIKNIIDTKTGKSINDFHYTSIIFTKENSFFPELLVFETIQETQAQSSQYSNQLFAYKDGNWKKHDAFTAFPYGGTDDGLIMGTTKGFGIYYPNYSKMLTEKDGLLQLLGGIPTLYTDKNGIVWISYSYSALPAYAQTFNTGINIWDGKKLRGYTERDGLLSNITFSTFQDSKMRVWIPTSKGITSAREILNSEGEQIFKFKNIESNKRKLYNTTNVIETKQGEIYIWQNYVRPELKDLIKADFYFGKFDGEKIIEIKSPFIDADNNKKYQLFDLREDNDGRLWFIGLFSDNIKDLTSVPSRIMIYDGKNWSEPPQNWNVPNEQIHYVGKLKNGIYFLTVGGFHVFNGKRFVNLSDSVNSTADFRILKGASVAGTKTDIQAGGNLYIRLRNRGLIIFDGTHLNFYTKKEGLPSTNISNPVVDSKGNVFFGFPGGALQVRGDKFQTYYDDENVVAGGPYGAIMDGRGNLIELYNGVGLYINKGENSSYPLKISSLIVNNQYFFYKYPDELNYSQNSFVFNYAALNYRDPRQTTYEHFLEGFDKEWSRPSNLSFVEYQNLPTGEYRFRVRAITSNGMKSNEDFYSFTINPPWWLTWWAYGIYIVGFVGIMGRVRKYELDRRREKENKKFMRLENERKTKEIEQSKEIEKAYTELKSTQAQLIHSEKMASLGELTAGIAHEIKNPLNFVNNFSEISKELLDEMKVELKNDNKEEVLAIAESLKLNLDKINQHGKRADSIVKGMLLHSRGTSGEKALTNINDLLDQYVMLAYHGMRAQNKEFNITIDKDYDSSLEKINVVPQDISRVFLNLVNNACYAANEKKQKSGNEFAPLLSVSTKNLKDKVEIRIRDNGNGIPAEIRDKLFNPFFTTKPTGEGTGLGLSLSYDIVVKQHSGEIKFESEEGEHTEFVIALLKNNLLKQEKEI